MKDNAQIRALNPTLEEIRPDKRFACKVLAEAKAQEGREEQIHYTRPGFPKTVFSVAKSRFERNKERYSDCTILRAKIE